jgi:hypothetical protein
MEQGMARHGEKAVSASCRCGKVKLEITGSPILSGICYCASCQEAGRQHQALPGADIVLGNDGGTDYVLYRKDRVRCVDGGEYLEECRLKSTSPTRRMNARCCNSAMFVDFTRGHWLTMYRRRVPDDTPPPSMRMMIADRPKGVELPDDMANYAGHSGKFMWKLLRAWLGMGFRRPPVEGVP